MMRCASAILLVFTSAALAQVPAAVTAVETSPGFRETATNSFTNYEAKLTTHCATVTPDYTKATHKI